jgi:hypothetical protein
MLNVCDLWNTIQCVVYNVLMFSIAFKRQMGRDLIHVIITYALKIHIHTSH